jgi:L-threonylcarbamoyladenylate synthase
VPDLPERIAALGSLTGPVMQSSANRSGEPDARTLQEVPPSLLEGADLVLDGGELPGIPSTVIDLRDFHPRRRWHLLREGALPRESVEQLLAPLC